MTETPSPRISLIKKLLRSPSTNLFGFVRQGNTKHIAAPKTGDRERGAAYLSRDSRIEAAMGTRAQP